MMKPILVRIRSQSNSKRKKILGLRLRLHKQKLRLPLLELRQLGKRLKKSVSFFKRSLLKSLG